MELNELLFLMREASGLTQQSLSAKVKLDRSALAKFERGKGRLPIKTLEKITKILGIKPEFVHDNQIYPFANDFYLLFTSSRMLGKLDLINNIFSISNACNTISLIPDISVWVELKRRILYDAAAPYVIIIQDDRNRIFVFRDKSPNAFIHMHPKKSISQATNNLLRALNKKINNFVFYESYVRSAFYEKLNKWTVNRKDVESLFDVFGKPTLSKDEDVLLSLISKENFNAKDLIDNFPKIKNILEKKG